MNTIGVEIREDECTVATLIYLARSAKLSRLCHVTRSSQCLPAALSISLRGRRNFVIIQMAASEARRAGADKRDENAAVDREAFHAKSWCGGAGARQFERSGGMGRSQRHGSVYYLCGPRHHQQIGRHREDVGSARLPENPRSRRSALPIAEIGKRV